MTRKAVPGHQTLSLDIDSIFVWAFVMEKSQVFTSVFSVNFCAFAAGTESPAYSNRPIIAINLPLSFASHCQQRRASYYACKIRAQITQTCLTTGQIQLMILVQQANHQRSGSCDNPHSTSAQTARNANSTSEQRKEHAVGQFVPGAWDQINRNRLRPNHKQAKYDSERHQCRGYGQIA